MAPPHVVWHGKDVHSDYRVYYSEATSSGWITPENLSAGTTVNQYPQVALDGGGNPHVVWQGMTPAAVMRIYYNEDVPNTFYFAEGYTGAGFREYLCLGNSSSATVEGQGDLPGQGRHPHREDLRRSRYLPLHRRRQRRGGTGQGGLHPLLSPPSFIAERPMYFNYKAGGSSWTGGSDAVGAIPCPPLPGTSPKATPAPASTSGSACSTRVAQTAHLTFNFQTQEDGLVVPTGTYTVPAHSRATFKANDLLEGKSYQTSLKLTSDVPVVAERPMYFELPPGTAAGAGPGDIA